MASFETYNVNKSNVLRLLAEDAYSGKIDSNTPRNIALKLFPRLKPQYRCCVYKEREIIQERTNLGLGLKPDGRPLESDQMVYVLEAACDDCDIHRVRITDNCRKCLFKPCEKACHFGAIYEGDSKMHINYSLCKACTLCSKACAYGAIMVSERPCRRSCPTGALKHIPGEIAYIDENECINCGRCVANCPFGAISDVSFMVNVIDKIVAKKKVVAMVAPAIIGQFKKAGFSKIVPVLNKLGFSEVYEVASGADITTETEANEVLEAKKKGQKLTTSCCPAFVEYIKRKFAVVYENNTSTTLSPMALTARLVKEKEADAVTVFIGPCIAKKLEATLEKNKDYVDYVLTFEELSAMIAAKNIEIDDEPEVVDLSKSASAASHRYCYSGGVAASLNEYLKEQGKSETITYVAASGAEEVNERLKLLSKGLQEEDILEGMMCEGGCISGVISYVTNPASLKMLQKSEEAKYQDIRIAKPHNIHTHYDKSKN